jgi:hypothetical protein
MLKRLCLAFAGLFALASGAMAAGTIPGISMTQQLDQFAHPLSGGQLYFIQAGTTSTPQSCYQDTALTPALAWPNPLTLDASGRVPQIFCADGNIKIRLTDRNGVTQLVQDNLLVIGASSGGGGGGTVDPTTILATGDVKVAYGTSILSGFVRANGRTIGSATSGATERANADTSALFIYLWGADANLAVSGGRGVSAAADFAANKTIALPDWRGRALAGLDDMGNSAAGRLTSTYFGASAIVLGAAGGAESKTLLTANLPPYTPAGSVSGSISGTAPANNTTAGNSGSPISVYSPVTGSALPLVVSGTFSGTLSGAAQGGLSTPVAVASPMMLATIYLKL